MSADPETQLHEDLCRFTLDPLGFVRWAWPWREPGGPLEEQDGPYDWQADILREIGTRLRRGYQPGDALMPVLAAVASGHGVGKSCTVAWLTHWALSTGADTRVVITANTEPQLRTKTWPELGKWVRSAINAHHWAVRGMSIVSVDRAHAQSWRADAVTWSVDNLEAFAGLHNAHKRIVLIFDEASGIDDRVWEVAEGALTDEDTEIIWAALGNPTRAAGRFHAIFGRDKARWLRRQIDARTVPGTNKGLIEEWRQAYGEDSDFFRVRVRGEFPRSGSMQFIGAELVEEACRREVAAQRSDALVLGVDVARFGDDETVIATRKGRDATLIPWVRLRGADTMTVAGRIAEMAQLYTPDMVFVDGGGVGGGVVDRCRQLRVRVTEVQFGGKADRAAHEVASAETLVKYGNKRAEMYGYMRAWLAGGRIPDEAELRAQLTGVEYGFNGQDEILLERKQDMKKRGLSSPDLSDALALTFAYPVLPSALAGGPMGSVQRQVVHDYDPLEGV
ncbi:MAG: terminase [Patescibacteria group bacterium]|nr:terminase [Patescibacteria group bacterium]